MKKNLLVTLADKNYIDQAKQLFSSVYFKAGWQGDYLLLAHDVLEEELQWFKDKGILVKKCQPLYNKEVGGMLPVLTSKFYLFTSEFKKWDNIVYIDADSTVKASLDELTKIKGFAAVRNTNNDRLKSQIINTRQGEDRGISQQVFEQLQKQIKKDYNLRAPVFCAGFFAFSTDIIKEDTFDVLNNTLKQYEKISCYGDQLIFNLFFYKQWKVLPTVYNIYLIGNKNQWFIKPKKIKGIIFHFVSPAKPWLSKNYFYQEWKDNLNKVESINLENIPAGNEWTKPKIIIYSNYLKFRFFYNILRDFLFFLDKQIGLVGLFLRRNIPFIYRLLKRREAKVFRETKGTIKSINSRVPPVCRQRQAAAIRPRAHGREAGRGILFASLAHSALSSWPKGRKYKNFIFVFYSLRSAIKRYNSRR